MFSSYQFVSFHVDAEEQAVPGLHEPPDAGEVGPPLRHDQPLVAHRHLGQVLVRLVVLNDHSVDAMKAELLA